MAKKPVISPLRFSDTWKYDASPESTDHINLSKSYGHFIDGKFVKPSSGKYFNTINPARETVLSEVADGSSSDVNKAYS